MRHAASSITASRRAIRLYYSMVDDVLEKSRTLLQDFNTVIKKDFLEQQQEILIRSKQLIARFREKQLHHFDIFRKAGFIANENSFSDAVAAILDPHESHRLGKKPLIQLLERLANCYPDKVNHIKEVIEYDTTEFVVRREKRYWSSRPDIEIFGSEFIIVIENKVEGGKESLVFGKPQTTRHWEGIINKCQKRGIPEKNALGIYLTPKGEPAEDKHFIPLSVPVLVSAFRTAIISADTEAKQSLLIFLDYYQWA